MKNQDTEKLWDSEYQKQGIPSSFLSEASGTVQYFFKFLEKQGVTSGTALDVGCGRGRNSIFLAQKGFNVHSIDIVERLVDELNALAQEKKIQVQARSQDLTDPLPFEDETFDIIIDVFVYKHQTSKSQQAAYRKEIKRIIKPDGYYLLALASDDDGFYGPLLASSPDPKNKEIVDPYTKVGSYLYSREDVEEEFGSEFDIIDFQHKKKKGPMHGKEYIRSTMLFVMQKRS